MWKWGSTMKRSVLIAAVFASASVPALAADLPVKARPAPPPFVEMMTWNGFYIGINGGYSWGHSSRDLNFYNPLTGVTLVTAAGGGRNLDGGLFGGQIGYNWQASNWVFGIEADAQWTGQKGSTAVFCPVVGCFPGLIVVPGGTSAAISDKLEWFGTIRGRVGVTVTPSLLLYATGGGAFGSVNTDLAVSTVTATGVPISIAASRKTDRFGWTVGAGIETMFASNWSAKLEYLYVDLGSISNSVVLPTTAGFPLAANVTSRVTDNIIRAGINYHFSAGPGPVVARY
jgi:outer membrane immunogenic protein